MSAKSSGKRRQEKTLALAAAAPGYDQAQTREAGLAGSHHKTAVFSSTDATAAPSAGGAEADPQA